MRLIPAIDLRGGKCVRLFQGRFDAETVYSGDPAEILQRYAALGAALVHIVDLDGARAGTQANRPAIEALAASGLAQLQVGGGVRTSRTVEELRNLGVSRVVVGSVAVTDPAEVGRWLDSFGAERIVLAFDVRLDTQGVPMLTTHGWEQQSTTSLWEAVESYCRKGLKHVLCTDVARDGALSGPNVELYAEATRRFPQVEWQASGGVRDVADLHALRQTGAAAVISGRALLEGRMQRQELEPFLRNA